MTPCSLGSIFPFLVGDSIENGGRNLVEVASHLGVHVDFGPHVLSSGLLSPNGYSSTIQSPAQPLYLHSKLLVLFELVLLAILLDVMRVSTTFLFRSSQLSASQSIEFTRGERVAHLFYVSETRSPPPPSGPVPILREHRDVLVSFACGFPAGKSGLRQRRLEREIASLALPMIRRHHH